MNRKSPLCSIDSFVELATIGNADSDSCFQLRPIVLKSVKQGLCLREREAIEDG